MQPVGDLLMVSGYYLETSANAPGPEVHVRFPIDTLIGAMSWTNAIIACNLK